MTDGTQAVPEPDPPPAKAEPVEAGNRLLAAKRAARKRYELIALALKMEAGVTRHYKHKSISGLAWTDKGRILAPEGITRRQLYVLAHECGHIVLHRSSRTWGKPAHVKELEAEVYAHRAFARYGLEVPERSSRWARQYVGMWIMKDHAAGIPISEEAVQFVTGKRSPSDPLAGVDGQPSHDFSKKIERFIAKGNRIAEQQDQEALLATPTVTLPDTLPNSCATCWFFESGPAFNWQLGRCNAFKEIAGDCRTSDAYCKQGAGWRPDPALVKRYSYERVLSEAGQQHIVRVANIVPERKKAGFWSRLGDAIIDRVSGRYRVDALNEQELIAVPSRPRIEVK